MNITAPKARLILDYKTYFGVEPPVNRISIIKDVSKNSILFEISALNYRLKPNSKVQIDYSLETQVKELENFTMSRELLKKYSRIAEKYTKSKEDFPIIFNRQGCLFAIEEIINSDEIKDIENFEMARVEVWDAIFKYLLAVNFAITQIKEDEDDQSASFESINPKLLSLNELLIETDPVFTFYCGYCLIDYFLKESEFSEEVKSYFQEYYGIEAHHFIYYLMSMYMANGNKDLETNFFYLVKDGEEDFFEKLSRRINNKETYKLISIRKSPFIKVGKLKYLIADNSFLVEKAYSQFLNDFWFDRIKEIKGKNGKPRFTFKFYRRRFGYFFEKYISEVLRKSFENYNYSKLLMFDELDIKTNKGNVEIADIYLRYGNKIILGQVKSGSIYDSEKFGGDVESLYKNDRSKFFENFGVDQLVKSLRRMDEYIYTLDPKFPKGRRYKVYPCIIVNDKSFQTPLMPDTFNNRFRELVSSFDIKKVILKPLTMIHINDLERLEDTLSKNPNEIWKLLEYNHRDKRFAPPFCNTINRNSSGSHYPPRIMKLFKELLRKYKSINAE